MPTCCPPVRACAWSCWRPTPPPRRRHSERGAWAGWQRRAVRVGQGWDIHRLVAGRPLRLGGVEVPCERGLLGHSDGDVVLHAVTDALLGALAAGDIGQRFPDTDPKLRGIDSAVLLAEVVQLAARRGYRIGNVDVTILAERPKL